MYGKTCKLHNSPALAPAKAFLASSSLPFDGLHDNIKIFILARFYRKLLKKRRLHSEREPTIIIIYPSFDLLDGDWENPQFLGTPIPLALVFPWAVLAEGVDLAHTEPCTYVVVSTEVQYPMLHSSRSRGRDSLLYPNKFCSGLLSDLNVNDNQQVLMKMFYSKHIVQCLFVNMRANFSAAADECKVKATGCSSHSNSR